MMGIYVDLMEQLRLRISDACLSDGRLADHQIQSVSVGSMLQVNAQINLPQIVIFPTMLKSGARYTNKGQRDTIDITVRVLCNSLMAGPDTTNTIYDTASSLGLLYLLEDVMNVIERNTSDSVDLGMNGKTETPLEFNVVIVPSESDYEMADIRFTLETKSYQAGSR